MLIVAKDGSGDFTTVQAAVDAAPAEGGEILIRAGEYKERVIVNKSRLLIRGERTDYEEAISVTEDAEFTPVEESTWANEYRHGLLYGVISFAGIGACYGICKALGRVQQDQLRTRHRKAEDGNEAP